jgi:hypothetical protein
MIVSKSNIITGIAHLLDRGIARLAAPTPARPWWQRILLPLVGVCMVAVGIVGCVTPLPLAMLAVIGWPFVLCFHPRTEAWGRRWMVGRLRTVRRWLGA